MVFVLSCGFAGSATVQEKRSERDYFEKLMELSRKDDRDDVPVRGLEGSSAYRYVMSLPGEKALLLAKQACRWKSLGELSGKELFSVQLACGFALQRAEEELGQDALADKLLEDLADPQTTVLWRGLILARFKEPLLHEYAPEHIPPAIKLALAFIENEKNNPRERAWLLRAVSYVLWSLSVRFYERDESFRHQYHELNLDLNDSVLRARQRGLHNPYENLLRGAVEVVVGALQDPNQAAAFRSAAAQTLNEVLFICGEKELVRQSLRRSTKALARISANEHEPDYVREACLLRLRNILPHVEATEIFERTREDLVRIVETRGTPPEVALEAGRVLARVYQHRPAAEPVKEKLRQLQADRQGNGPESILIGQYRRLLAELERIPRQKEEKEEGNIP